MIKIYVLFTHQRQFTQMRLRMIFHLNTRRSFSSRGSCNQARQRFDSLRLTLRYVRFQMPLLSVCRLIHLFLRCSLPTPRVNTQNASESYLYNEKHKLYIYICTQHALPSQWDQLCQTTRLAFWFVLQYRWVIHVKIHSKPCICESLHLKDKTRQQWG